jgi:L-ascorbate metabolism protein UlaG (beta-lactamase superfamily)
MSTPSDGPTRAASLHLPSTPSDSQVRWLGHAMVEIVLDGMRFLTDPVFRDFSLFVAHRAARPMRPALAGLDAVLISHAHQDHMHLPSLRELDPGVLVVTPAGTGHWLERHGVQHVEELAPGGFLEVGPVRIRATHAEHDGSRLPAGPRAVAVGYLIEGSRTMYFAGDTDLFEEMGQLRALSDTPIEAALLPVGGWGPTLRGGHMTPERAAEALRLVQPRMAVPIHWGTYWPRGFGRVRPIRFYQPGMAFEDAAREAAPGVLVVVLSPGESLALPGDTPGSSLLTTP